MDIISDKNDHDIGDADMAAATNQLTYNTASSQTKARGVIDPGACYSVVDKRSLVAAMREMGVTTIPDGVIRRKYHRFGDYMDERTTVCAINIPFRSVGTDGQQGAQF